MNNNENAKQAFYITSIALKSLDIPKGVLVQKTRNGAIKILARKVGNRSYAEKIVNYSFDKLLESGAIVYRSVDMIRFETRNMYPHIFNNKNTPSENNSTQTQESTDGSSEKST